MKTTLWIVIVIVAVFMGFLLGYSVSAYTGIQAAKGNIELETSGYGDESEGAGYGASETEGAGYGASESEGAGYGASEPASGEEPEEYNKPLY